ncbi:MAG: CD36 family protein [Candidatus Thalassarchaeum betae]|nr:CD36 family protein [Candidatus Thalassoarchaea betae]
MNRNKSIAMMLTGIILVSLNMFVLTGVVASNVQAGVEELIVDGRDDASDWEDEEWLVQTSERSYFAYNLTNPGASLNDEVAVFEKMGPFIYTVTTTKDILDFDADNGTITYSEYDSFEWCENCTWADDDGNEHASVSGEYELTNANILWNTQRMAGLATGITYGEIFAKAGFAQQMQINDLQNRAPSIWAAEYAETLVAGAAAQINSTGIDMSTAEAMAPAAVLRGAYDGWLAQSGASDANPDFASYADGILYSAVDPDGNCIALIGDFACKYGTTSLDPNHGIGHMLAAGMGEPSETTTPVRATLYGYSDASSEEMTAIDWTVYAMAGANFVAMGGGKEIDSIEDWRERLVEVTGVDIPNPVALNNVLFGTEGSVPNNGMLMESDFGGIPLFGVALFLLGAQGDAFGTMVTYSIGLTQLLGLSDWGGAWIGMVGTPLEFPMILVGGSGTNDADSWWQLSFGSKEPVAGGYISIGLNRGDYEGAVDLSAEKVREILYDSEYALTGDFATVFIYGEFSGFSLPAGPEGSAMGGTVHTWDDAYVAGLYGISESDAAALRSWVKDFMFEQVIGALLTFQYGASAWTTQSINNWLYGWSDQVLVGLFGEENSWVKLETNETYYGSGGKSTGDFSVYQMKIPTSVDGLSTAEHAVMEGYINSDGDGLCDFKLDADGNAEYAVECEANETYGMTEHLPWRAPHVEAATYGLLSDHVGNANTIVAGTIGGIADADESFSVNLVGYSVAQTEVGDTVTYKEIEMVEHSIDLNPAENQIQAKLVGSGTFVDVLPGALPVYFGASVDIKVEPVTNVAMYGKVMARFYLDLRWSGAMNPDFSDADGDGDPDASYVQAVFEIHTFSEISDDDAASFKCTVIDHMSTTWWTDFGGKGDCELEALMPFPYIAALLYVVGIGLLSYGGMGMATVSRKEE